MRLQPDDDSSRYRIRSYRSGVVVVNDEALTSSFILTPETLLRDWPVDDLDSLQPATLEPVIALDPEIVLIATGERATFAPRAVLAALAERGIGVECMDVGAACRSFVVLAAERRRVAAAFVLGPRRR